MRIGTVRLSGERLLAITPIFVERSGGDLGVIEAKIDTGFTEWLGLPTRYIDDLGLDVVDVDKVTFADNTEKYVDVYAVNVIWGQQNYRVKVHNTGTMPLIGMSFLNGKVLTIDARHGGAVEIEPATDSIA